MNNTAELYTKHKQSGQECHSNTNTFSFFSSSTKLDFKIVHCYTIRYKLKILKGNARSFQLISSIPQKVSLQNSYIKCPGLMTIRDEWLVQDKYKERVVKDGEDNLHVSYIAYLR